MSTESTSAADPVTDSLPATSTKSSKLVSIARAIAGLAILIASVAGTWNYFANKSANNSVDDANTHFQQATALNNEAAAKHDVFVKAVQAFPENRAELEGQGRDVAAIFGRSAEQYRLAAAKTGEAGETTIDVDVSNYFKGKANRYTKAAEFCEEFQKRSLLVTDPAIQTPDELAAKHAEFDARAVALDKEGKDLEAAADKIRADHPAKFQ